MSEKEFRKLKRVELVEIIYQLEQELANVKQENERLNEQLNAKKSELEHIVSIEQAIAKLNRVCDAMGLDTEELQDEKETASESETAVEDEVFSKTEIGREDEESSETEEISEDETIQ